MVKLLKITLLLLAIILIMMSGTWYYVTSKVAGDVNSQYAGKKISLKSLDDKDYFVTFKNMKPAGFPYKIAWNIEGWTEESKGSYIEYQSPIKLGYDMVKGKLFVDYSGDIIASYKPKQHGFGSRLNISDYRIDLDVPLSVSLINDLKNTNDPAVLINHIKNIAIGTKKVEIFDLVDKEKFYDKEFEKVNITFVPAKKYINMQDFLDHIPQKYTVDYTIKTNHNKAEIRRLPVSLFYGFAVMPSDLRIGVHADISTQGSSYKDYKQGLKINAQMDSDSPFLKVSKAQIDYNSKQSKTVINHNLRKTANFTIKTGFFDKIITTYQKLNNMRGKGDLAKFVDSEIDYIIKHRNSLNLENLENNDYEIIFDISSESRGSHVYSKLNDLSILSSTSGIKLQHKMEQNLKNNRFKADGVLYLNNYPSIVEFVSAYIYRFGKYRALTDIARGVYISVNKSFLKKISDHPKSKSDDLSLEYKIDSRNYPGSKVGSTTIAQIVPLYTLTLYQKLFDEVGYEGDVLSKMREIIPSIDGNEPMLKKILPKISIKEKFKKNIETIIPKQGIKDELLKLF